MPDAIDTLGSRRRLQDDASADECTRVVTPRARPKPCSEDALSTVTSDAPLVDYSAALKNRSLRDTPLLPEGIELASIASPPATSRNDPSRTIHAPPYDLHAEMTTNPDGSSSVAYFAAYNKDSKRLEYVVQPDAVADFVANVAAFKVGASVTMVNGGPTREYQKESIRAVDSLMHGNPGDAARHGALAYREALTDPAWYAEVAMGTAWGMVGNAAKATPVLRLVTEEAGLEVPTVARLASRPLAEVPVSLVSREAGPAVEGNLARATSSAPAPSRLSLVASNPNPLVLSPPPLAALVTPLVLAARNAALTRQPGIAPRVVSRSSERGSDDDALSCVPRPLGRHLGGDPIHDACADAMGNVFPKSDVMVGGKAFDALTIDSRLLEVKTGYPSRYRGEGSVKAFGRWTAEARKDATIASRCGFPFVLAVADPNAVDALREEFLNDENVTVTAADKDECVR